MRATRTAIIILGIAVGGLLAGCSGAETPATPTTVTATATVTARIPAPTPAPVTVTAAPVTVTAPAAAPVTVTAAAPADSTYNPSDPGAFSQCEADAMALTNAGDYEGSLRKNAVCRSANPGN